MRTAVLLSALLLVGLLSAPAFAMPGMSGHWTMTVSPSGGSVSATGSASGDLNATFVVVKMHGRAFGIPVAMKHMRFQHVFAPSPDSNVMTITVTTRKGTREFNIVAPPVAVQHAVAHIQQHFQLRVDQNTVDENLLSHVRLSECQEFNASNGTITYKPCYVAPVKVRARLLGLFPVTTTEAVVVDAQTGKVQVRGPWWSFLLLGKAEITG